MRNPAGRLFSAGALEARLSGAVRAAPRRGGAVLALLLLLLAPSLAAQRVSFPERPAPGVYHVDRAGIIRPAEAAEIDRIAGQLLAEHDVPIVVVTLPDLASFGAAGYTIERADPPVVEQLPDSPMVAPLRSEVPIPMAALLRFRLDLRSSRRYPAAASDRPSSNFVPGFHAPHPPACGSARHRRAVDGVRRDRSPTACAH